MSFVRESVMVNGKPLTFETGRLAKQAHGSVLVTYGESVVLVTAVCGDERPGLDFFPLTCEYVEKTFAAGKIPGGFFKREGRLRDDEILVARIIDRPCRPLFPEGFKKDTQIIATVLSSDKVNPTDVLALTGASAALHISDIPWDGPLAGMRVARVNGELVIFPTFEQQAESDLDMVVACSKTAIVMVEGGAAEATEKDVIDALMFAHEQAQPILQLIERMRAAIGRPKREFTPPKLPDAIAARIPAIVDAAILESSLIRDKAQRYAGYKAAKEKMVSTLTQELGAETFAANEKLIKAEFDERKYNVVREYVLGQNRRIDGRDMATIRPIMTEVGLLPRVHGSALFQRGETQAIVTATLGTSADEQKIDGLTGERWKRFLLHYNFPPFSTGETKPLRGPGRREVGHGALAERALLRQIPDAAQFPYTIRIVSETLESNGSSSMAAVCGGTMSLMDAGVPLKAPVAGIAMGLIAENGKFAVLSDILGDEDHLGDMDFKVVGTKKGITAVQMDIKVESLTWDVMSQALKQAKDGRLHILGEMDKTIREPADDLSPHAPRIFTVIIDTEKIRDVIGPGGKHIRAIVAETGCDIDINDDGRVDVAAVNGEAAARAIELIRSYTSEPEVGKIYLGTVTKTVDFGAFVAIMPGTEGLCHISELAEGRVRQTEDVVKEGDKVMVKVLGIDRQGKIKLSRRAALEEQGATAAAPVEA